MSRCILWICVTALVFSLISDHPAYAQKRKAGGKSKDSESQADEIPETDPEGPEGPFSLEETGERANPAHEAKVRQAQEAYQAGRYEDCIKLTTEVLREDPTHSVARYHRASALVDQGRRDKAMDKVRAGIADAREALGIAGRQHLIFHIPYFYGLTSLSELENRPAHAELAVKVATPLLDHPELPKDVKGLVYFQRALAKTQLKDYLGAANDYGEAIQLDPEFQAAHFNRAEAFVKAKQLSKAREAFDLAVTLMAEDPLAYNNRGSFHLQQGRVPLAIADFTRALELNESFTMAALNRGYAHAQQREWRQAEEDYELALQIDPRQLLALKLLGTAQMNQSKFQEAVETYTRGISLAGQDADVYSSRGYSRFFAGDYAGAGADFARARQLNSTTALYIPWRYWSQVRSGDTDAARKDLQAFVKSQPATPNWHVTLCKYFLGELDDEGLLKQANNTSDESAKSQWLCEAYYFMGLQALQQGQSDAARKHFEASVATKQSQLMAYQGAKFALDK